LIHFYKRFKMVRLGACVLMAAVIAVVSAQFELPCPQEIALMPKLNDRIWMYSQINCILDKGPCDEVGKTAKRIGADALTGHCPRPCDKCTKKAMRQVIGKLQNEYPAAWFEIQKKLLSQRQGK
jgi:hypothetical protein